VRRWHYPFGELFPFLVSNIAQFLAANSSRTIVRTWASTWCGAGAESAVGVGSEVVRAVVAIDPGPIIRRKIHESRDCCRVSGHAVRRVALAIRVRVLKRIECRDSHRMAISIRRMAWVIDVVVHAVHTLPSDMRLTGHEPNDIAGSCRC